MDRQTYNDRQADEEGERRRCKNSAVDWLVTRESEQKEKNRKGIIKKTDMLT